MFTLAFYRHDSSEKTVVCGARYTVREGERTAIWVYPTVKQENAVLMDLYHEADAENVYYEVFVTNEAGKTVDRFRAYSLPEEEATNAG